MKLDGGMEQSKYFILTMNSGFQVHGKLGFKVETDLFGMP
jgi:hypothetical protein